MPDHWFFMCNQCICEPKCWGDVTNVYPHGSMDTGEQAVPALGMGQCEITDLMWGVWNHRSFGGWLETKTGEHRIWRLFFQAKEKQWTWLFPSFVLFCFLDYVFLCTPTNQTCLGVSTSLQTFAARLGLPWNLSDSVLDQQLLRAVWVMPRIGEFQHLTQHRV